MNITALGKYLRILRLNHAEIMKVMAEKVGVSVAYLSSVELGNKAPSNKFLKNIELSYGLKGDDLDEFRSAAAKSLENVNIDLTSFDDSDKKLALVFARKISELNRDEKNELARLLEKGTHDEISSCH